MVHKMPEETIGGEERVRFVKDLQEQFSLMHVYIVGNTDSIDEDDAEELKEQIANKLALGTQADAKDWWWTPASGMTEQFLKRVQRTLERGTEKKKSPWRHRLRYAWKILVELAYLAIVVGIFSIATSKFETVVFAILVLIYNSTTSVAMGVGLGFAYGALSLQVAYGEIGRRLRLRVPVAPAREAEKQVKGLFASALIHNISVGVGSLIALWQIVSAILR
jgi:hypothetical protein